MDRKIIIRNHYNEKLILYLVDIDLNDIINGCKAEKPAAQKQLFQIYQKKMFGICLRYSKDYTEAEDIAQEGFVRIFQNFKQFRSEGSVESWMKKIMINTALEKFRKKRENYFSVDNIADYEKDFGVNHIISEITAKDLMKLVQKLSPQYRVVFSLYALDGYKHHEISKMLNISTGTSKSNLSRARQILMTEVERLFEEKYKYRVRKTC